MLIVVRINLILDDVHNFSFTICFFIALSITVYLTDFKQKKLSSHKFGHWALVLKKLQCRVKGQKISIIYKLCN